MNLSTTARPAFLNPGGVVGEAAEEQVQGSAVRVVVYGVDPYAYGQLKSSLPS